MNPKEVFETCKVCGLSFAGGDITIPSDGVSVHTACAGIKNYAPSTSTLKMVEDCFTYHPPRPDQLPRYVIMRDKGKELATLFAHFVPEGREKAMALSALQNAIMHANAGIACGEKE